MRRVTEQHPQFETLSFWYRVKSSGSREHQISDSHESTIFGWGHSECIRIPEHGQSAFNWNIVHTANRVIVVFVADNRTTILMRSCKMLTLLNLLRWIDLGMFLAFSQHKHLNGHLNGRRGACVTVTVITNCALLSRFAWRLACLCRTVWHPSTMNCWCYSHHHCRKTYNYWFRRRKKQNWRRRRKSGKTLATQHTSLKGALWTQHFLTLLHDESYFVFRLLFFYSYLSSGHCNYYELIVWKLLLIDVLCCNSNFE